MYLRLCFAAAICLLAELTGHAQTVATADTGDRPAPSYLFVSPNTASGLTLDQAIHGMASADERTLISDARRLAQCLGVPARIQPAVGNWREGSEPSGVTREWTLRAWLRYQGARLGARWRQESVLLFRQVEGGDHRLYILRPRGRIGFHRMSAAMERAGIAFRTLVRERSGRSVVYVVEMSHDLGRLIRRAARSMHARVRTYAGEGEFFGHDNRDQSQELFRQEIEGFEAANPEVVMKCGAGR
jgi:hypothetical protein